MTLTISQWQKAAHDLAIDKGFYDGDKDPLLWDATRLMKMVAELAEAYEEVKAGREDLSFWYDGDKPVGLGIELADVFLFLVDFAESKGFDLEACVRVKHEYNCTRERMHGKKI